MQVKNKGVLTKSKLKQNQQCSKLLYFQTNHPELKESSSKDQTVFKVGREVEQLVRDKFKDYRLVDAFKNSDKVTQTENFIKDGAKAIAEASFFAREVHIQIDMLEHIEGDVYDAHEVKSSSKEKDEYLEDIAIQFWTVYHSNKIKIRNYYLWHINKNGTKENIFQKVDVTEKIMQMNGVYEDLRTSAIETYNATTIPDVKIGRQCANPYNCPFRSQCWKHIDENPMHVLNLPYNKQKWDLFNSGVELVSDEKIKPELFPNPKIIEAIKNKTLWIDKQKVLETIESWPKPLHFLDYESVIHYLPLFEGTRPYQNVVVQFSYHKMDSLDQNPLTALHESFLHEDYSSPLKPLADKMIATLGEVGAIVTYNKTFEISRTKEVAEALGGEYKEKLLKICDRFVDIMDVIKDHVYHPEFVGSYSLKQVSPTLLGVENGGYTDSLIKSGSEITQYYFEFLNTKDDLRKQTIKQALLKYCGYDTLNMILLMQWLIQKCKETEAAA